MDCEYICPKCCKRMVLRHGQHGDFYGCSQFPKCWGTRNLDGSIFVRLNECFARDIREGQWFRKRTGEYVYLRMSESAAKHLKLDPEWHIYGTCFNGNVVAVHKSKIVVACTVDDYLRNIGDMRQWEEQMGCKAYQVP